MTVLFWIVTAPAGFLAVTLIASTLRAALVEFDVLDLREYPRVIDAADLIRIETAPPLPAPSLWEML